MTEERISELEDAPIEIAHLKERERKKKDLET